MVIAGVDEAGRGPLAGPVVAAVAILTQEQEKELVDMGLRDSKKMSPKLREKVFLRMRRLGVIFRVVGVSAGEIDKTNILAATLWAMGKAVSLLPFVPDCVLVDGNQKIPNLKTAQRTIIRGDDIYPQISAASVVAKVLRDRAMCSYDKLYPGYGFSRHKGYGTLAHRKALAELGPSPIHRRSFSWKL